ncbi:MAG: metallophosphoesterase [Euryarchaeota archaeon]|nr:metallophosphoesterase [Euryarchaeota archaeon]
MKAPLVMLIFILISILIIMASMIYVSPNIKTLKEPPKFNKSAYLKVIGVISDTHIPKRSMEIPVKVFEIFKDVDLIIHAGDLVEIEVVRDLKKHAPVVAVYGNMDPYDVREKLPGMESVKIFDWKIGVVHDVGALWGIKEMKKIAKENDFDVLIFGHTHRPFVKEDEGILFFNPGSPTNPLPPFIIKPSVGLLKITKEKIEPIIIET